MQWTDDSATSIWMSPVSDIMVGDTSTHLPSMTDVWVGRGANTSWAESTVSGDPSTF